MSAMASGRPAPGALIEGARDVEEIPQDAMAVLGGDRFGMELHAVHRVGLVAQAHDDAVLGVRRLRRGISGIDSGAIVSEW